MAKILDCAGILLLFVVLTNVAFSYGSRWVIGRHGLPVSLLAPDGVHYADGSVVDPITLSVIRANIEEQVLVGLLLIGPAALGVRLWLEHRYDRWRKAGSS